MPHITPRRALRFALVLALVPLWTACSPEPVPVPAPEPTCALPDPLPGLAAGSLSLPPSPSVLVLGDSYTEGYGAEPETKGYAYLVGKPLGWRVTVDGVGGTGYVNPGPRAEGTYLQRLPRRQGQTYDLVVLQGGSNDRDTAYPVLRDAVSRTVDAVRSEFRGAVVVVLGPSTPYGKPDPTRLLSRCVLAGEAGARQLPFLDPIGEHWFVDGDGKRYANPEKGHPSNAGYRHIAGRFVADVRVLEGTTSS